MTHGKQGQDFKVKPLPAQGKHRFMHYLGQAATSNQLKSLCENVCTRESKGDSSLGLSCLFIQ
jgi:hypothetical protein